MVWHGSPFLTMQMSVWEAEVVTLIDELISAIYSCVSRYLSLGCLDEFPYNFGGHLCCAFDQEVLAIKQSCCAY